MPLTYLLPFFLDTLPMILAGKAGYDNSLDFYYTHDGCHGASRTKTHSIYVEAGCYVVYFVVIFTALRDLHRNVRAVRAGVEVVVEDLDAIFMISARWRAPDALHAIDAIDATPTH